MGVAGCGGRPESAFIDQGVTMGRSYSGAGSVDLGTSPPQPTSPTEQATKP